MSVTSTFNDKIDENLRARLNHHDGKVYAIEPGSAAEVTALDRLVTATEVTHTGTGTGFPGDKYAWSSGLPVNLVNDQPAI